MDAPGEADARAATPIATTHALGEVLLCSGVVTQAVIGLLLRSAGLAPLGPRGQLLPGFVFALSALDALVLVGLIAWLLRRRGESLRQVVTGARPLAREVQLGVLLAPVLLVGISTVVLALRAALPALHNVPVNPLASLLGSPLQLAAFALVVLVAGAVREEVQRAFLLHRFAQALGGPWVGLAVTTVGFGLGHTLQGWDAAVATGMLGGLWGVLYLTRGSAVASMVSHAVFNLAELARAALLAP